MPRRGVRLLLAAALLLAVAPAVRAEQRTAAPALVNPVTGRHAPLADYLHAGWSFPDALRLRLLDQLVAAGVPRGQVALRASQGPQGPCLASSLSMTIGGAGDIQAAGDLDGDQRPDVLEVHSVAVTTKTSSWTAAARDATTGRLLWRRSLVLDRDHGAFLLATGVGRPARPGGLLVRYASSTTTRGATETVSLTLTFEGLDGHGRTVWRQALHGTASGDPAGFSESFHDYPWDLALGRFRPGTDDLVVSLLSGDLSASAARFERLGLAAGDLSRPYPALAPAASGDVLGQVQDVLYGSGGWPVLAVVPDQNGDRRSDVALLRSGGSSPIRVFRGDTGASIWSSLPLPPGAVTELDDAGVLTQGETRVHDLAVVLRDASVEVSVAGVSVPGSLTAESDRTSGLVVLLQAGTGRVGWVLPGAGVLTMHRYKGTPAIGLVSTDVGFPPVLTPPGRYLQVDVVDANGLPVATNRYALQQTLPVCAGAWVLVGNEDDLNTDGSPEAQVDFQQYDEVDLVDTYVTIDGATGAVRDRSEAFVVDGSVDGRGTDRALVRAQGTALRVTVVRGEDVRSTLVTTTLPYTGQFRFGGNAHALPATSLACQDVEAASYTSDATTLQLLASNGRAWWTLRVNKAHPVGAVQRGAGARPRC